MWLLASFAWRSGGLGDGIDLPALDGGLDGQRVVEGGDGKLLIGFEKIATSLFEDDDF